MNETCVPIPMRLKRVNVILCAILLCVSGVLTAGAGASQKPVETVSVAISKPFFNPSLNQSVSIRVDLTKAGVITLLILDRDAFVARTLASAEKVTAGTHTYEWDGRLDTQEVASDEAWSVNISFKGEDGKTESYFPANQRVEQLSIRPKYYNAKTGILAYELPAPARVHIQAGTAVELPDGVKGPVLKTIANREPRTAGITLEHWPGFDESGTIYIPDLNHFVFSIAAWPLPMNSLITVGNRKETFVQSLAHRHGKSLLASLGHAPHHQGLTTLDDVSPELKVKPNAVWNETEKSWSTTDRHLKIEGYLQGPTASAFAKQPGKLEAYVDLDMVSAQKPPASHFELEVAVDKLAPGMHVFALNWSSDLGPAAVNSFRLHVPEKEVIAKH